MVVTDMLRCATSGPGKLFSLRAVPVTTVTAHSLDYCFAVIAPSCGAFHVYLHELGAAELAALFFSGCNH
jgi:hypothetical protein